MVDWKKKYRTIWLGQGVSIFTSAVIQMALIWYITEKTGSAAILTTATLIGYLPQVILGPFVGVIIDRYNRKFIMIFSDIYISVVSFIIIIAGMNGDISIWLILVVLFLRSIGSAFHNPSLQAVTPSFVPKEELTRYAGYAQGVESFSILLSPMAAAVLYGILDLHQIILFDVGGTLFAALTLCVVKIPKVKVTAEVKKTGMIQEAIDGIKVIKKEKGLGSLILISSLYAIIYFPIGTLFPLICMGYFNGSYLESGIVETVFAVGMLMGSLLLGVLGKSINKMYAISYSIGLYGLGLFISGLLPPEGLGIFIILAFVMGVSAPFYRGVKISIIQSSIDEQYLGRVLSLSNSLQTLAMPIGLILAGIFAEGMGVEKWFFISGAITLLLAVFSYNVSRKLNNDKLTADAADYIN